MSTGWDGIEFDLKCLKVVEAVEDEWNPLHVLFELDLTEEEEDGVGIYLVLTNVYGDFDVLGCNTTLPGRTTRCDSICDNFSGSNFLHLGSDEVLGRQALTDDVILCCVLQHWREKDNVSPSTPA